MGTKRHFVVLSGCPVGRSGQKATRVAKGRLRRGEGVRQGVWIKSSAAVYAVEEERCQREILGTKQRLA